MPLISNTDQGSQFTSEAFRTVESAGTEVSMDGRGRCLDNHFIERLWRSVKYEDIYARLRGRPGGRATARWFGEYNNQRPHQAALNYATPAQYYLDPDGHELANRLGLNEAGTMSYRECARRDGEERG